MNAFDILSPDAVIQAVEAAYACRIQPVVSPFSSYVNRVYGITTEDGRDLVAKFYRPGRWSAEAIDDEHSFMRELEEEEFPVVSPLPDIDGDTVAEIDLQGPSGLYPLKFALFPKRAGRLFDAEDDESWMRIGALCGRLHSVGARRNAGHRLNWTPKETTTTQLEWILSEDVLPGDMESDFRGITGRGVELIGELFDGIPGIRLHGDLHRGNILDRGDEGLLMIDLDDMVNGPAVQDLWLLLPGYRDEVGRETALLADGYEEFRPFPWDQLNLMEPLRFMRIIHFIAWCARQRRDRDFSRHFPDWGSRGWWVGELEDLRDQVGRIEGG